MAEYSRCSNSNIIWGIKYSEYFSEDRRHEIKSRTSEETIIDKNKTTKAFLKNPRKNWDLTRPNALYTPSCQRISRKRRFTQ